MNDFAKSFKDLTSRRSCFDRRINRPNVTKDQTRWRYFQRIIFLRFAWWSSGNCRMETVFNCNHTFTFDVVLCCRYGYLTLIKIDSTLCYRCEKTELRRTLSSWQHDVKPNVESAISSGRSLVTSNDGDPVRETTNVQPMFKFLFFFSLLDFRRLYHYLKSLCYILLLT